MLQPEEQTVMTRMPLKNDEQLDDDTRALFAGMVARGSKVPDLYRLLANAPELLQAWTNMAWPLRNVGHADRGLRELLIMRTAQLTGADYEWKHHWSMAVAAGVSEEKLGALATWAGSGLFPAQERAVLGMADAMVRDGHIAEADIQPVLDQFDRAAVIQLVLTVAFYICVGRVAGALHLDLEPGYEAVPDLPLLDGR
jgi:4-carboxymuconolactone decarboxylase